MRVKSAVQTRRRRNKVLKQTKGYYSKRGNCFRQAVQQLRRSLYFSYVSRRKVKRDFRSLWIIRINAALKEHGVSYSKFIGKLVKSNVTLNRKILADIAVSEPTHFNQIVSRVMSS